MRKKIGGLCLSWLALLPVVGIAVDTTPIEITSQNSRQIFSVAGGKEMEALKCTTPQRRKSPERRPAPQSTEIGVDKKIPRHAVGGITPAYCTRRCVGWQSHGS